MTHDQTTFAPVEVTQEDHMLAEAIAARNTRHSAPAGEVEPVAWKITDADGGYWFTDKPENPDLFDCEITQAPLYTRPAPPADLVELVEALRELLSEYVVTKRNGGFEPECIESWGLVTDTRALLAKHGSA